MTRTTSRTPGSRPAPGRANALLEEYREDHWGRERMFAARNRRAGQLRRAGCVVDVETIRVLEEPREGRPRVVRIARLLAYGEDAVFTVEPPERRREEGAAWPECA